MVTQRRGKADDRLEKGMAAGRHAESLLLVIHKIEH